MYVVMVIMYLFSYVVIMYLCISERYVSFMKYTRS